MPTWVIHFYPLKEIPFFTQVEPNWTKVDSNMDNSEHPCHSGFCEIKLPLDITQMTLEWYLGNRDTPVFDETDQYSAFSSLAIVIASCSILWRSFSFCWNKMYGVFMHIILAPARPVLQLSLTHLWSMAIKNRYSWVFLGQKFALESRLTSVLKTSIEPSIIISKTPRT